MKNLFKKIGTVLFFLFIGFIGLKSCISTVLSFDDKSVYEKVNSTGQIDRIFIISSNDILFSKNLEGTFEIARLHIRGEHSTNYFGSIYNIGTFPFGLRIYNGAKNVYQAEMELINKSGNVSESTFDEIGTTYSSTIIIYENSINIHGETFNKIQFSDEDIDRMMKLFQINNNAI